MIRSISIIVALLFLIPGGQALCESADDKPVMANQKFCLEESERLNLEQEAMLGSGEAALKLFQYYDFCASDYQKGLYWIQIAAENGDTTAQYNYAIHLMVDVGGELGKLGALYWFRKAAAAGDPVAKEKLEWLYYQP